MTLEFKDIFAGKGVRCREKEEQTAIDQAPVVGAETRQSGLPWQG